MPFIASFLSVVIGIVFYIIITAVIYTITRRHPEVFIEQIKLHKLYAFSLNKKIDLSHYAKDEMDKARKSGFEFWVTSAIEIVVCSGIMLLADTQTQFGMAMFACCVTGLFMTVISIVSLFILSYQGYNNPDVLL